MIDKAFDALLKMTGQRSASIGLRIMLWCGASCISGFAMFAPKAAPILFNACVSGTKAMSDVAAAVEKTEQSLERHETLIGKQQVLFEALVTNQKLMADQMVDGQTRLVKYLDEIKANQGQQSSRLERQTSRSASMEATLKAIVSQSDRIEARLNR